MKLLILCSVLLSAVLSTEFGSASVVVTSQDVKESQNESNLTKSLTKGDNYHVYAVFDSSASSDAYARNVIIKGANTMFTVADLAKAKSGTAYVLDDSKILKAPISISNTNVATTTRVPFSIYIVSTGYNVAPVVSAQLVNGAVDSSLAKLPSDSVVILSAEKNIQLSAFDSTADKIEVRTSGFDVITTDYSVMTLTKKTGMSSSVMISCPIATIRNLKATPTNFKFTVKRDAAWSGSLPSGASTSFLSNGFMNVWESYTTETLNDNTLTRNYDFGTDTQISFNPAVGNYYPDSGDSLKLSCVQASGQTTSYDLAKLAGSIQKDTCKSVGFAVKRGTKTKTGPRFVIELVGPDGFAW